jgi:hypothetical protein
MAKPPRKSSAPSSVDDDVTGFLASRALDNQADYVARGRAQKDLSEKELTEKWVQAFRRMADDPRNRESRVFECDLESEFRLRHKEPPYELVREERERYKSAALAAIKEITQDPDKFKEFGRDIEAEIEAYKAARDKRKN